MNEGTFTYFTLQHRLTHQTEHCKPHGTLKPLKNQKWSYSSWDSFGCFAEPWAGSGNNWKPQFKESSDETHDCWSKTGAHGWWTMKYGVMAVLRLRKASEEGKLNYKDGYNNETRGCRYDFKIVKVTVSKKVEEVSVYDIMENVSDIARETGSAIVTAVQEPNKCT